MDHFVGLRLAMCDATSYPWAWPLGRKLAAKLFHQFVGLFLIDSGMALGWCPIIKIMTPLSQNISQILFYISWFVYLETITLSTQTLSTIFSIFVRRLESAGQETVPFYTNLYWRWWYAACGIDYRNGDLLIFFTSYKLNRLAILRLHCLTSFIRISRQYFKTNMYSSYFKETKKFQPSSNYFLVCFILWCDKVSQPLKS